MAETANTGFKYYKSLSGNMAAPTSIPFRIANSTTLRLKDLVRVNTAGFVVTAGVGEAVGGVVVGLEDQNGINPFSLGYDTTGPSVTLTGDDQVATSSSNQTSANYINARVVVDPSGDILWLQKADAALARTNTFQYFDVDSNGRQVTVSTASDANGQVQLVLLDPEATGGKTADTTMGAFRIVENQFGLGIDSATAKNAA